MFKRVATAAVLTVATVAGAQAATLTNGSFESEALTGPNPWQEYSAGATNITGWDIAANVDLIANGGWAASDGSQSLDLVGSNFTGKSGVSQLISDLIVGTTYEVSFDYSGNPFMNTVTVGMNVNVGNENASFSYTTDASQVIDWEAGTFTFTASSTSQRLSFTATSSNAGLNGGIALDNVSISALPAVPLPAGGLMLLTALGAFGIARRKG